MELYEEVTKETEEKSKMPMFIGIGIGVLIIMIILVIVGILYLKDLIVTIKVDDVKNNEVQQLLHIESSKLYFPIIKMSEYLKYEGYVGHYQNKSEDNTKCHVVCENETAMFSLNSNELIKITNGKEYEYITLDEPVFEKDGELYTTIYGMEKAFNLAISTDEE